MRALRRQHARGATTLELALVLPLFVVMLLFSLFITELVRAKLKVQEAARFAAWELTSYTLSDYGGGQHETAFEEARARTLEDLNVRFSDLDSVEAAAPPPSFILTHTAVAFDLQHQAVPTPDVPLELSDGAGVAVDAVAGGGAWITERFGFNPAGQVRVSARTTVRNRILPETYLDGPPGSGAFFGTSPSGGVDLSSLALSSNYTLVASGWHLPDGSDATVSPLRAGVHRGGGDHGLYTQVKRMTFLGGVFTLPAFSSLSAFLDNRLPALAGTFVVSHGYGLTDRGASFEPDQDCSGEHPAKMGLRNLLRMEPPLGANRKMLDDKWMRCFDTTPFRDTHEFDAALGLQMWQVRGPNFMGCPNAQADDPTRVTGFDDDQHAEKVVCLDP